MPSSERMPSTERLSSHERLEQIVAAVDERGFLSVGEISELFDVSQMTIRRDLELLDRQKRLQRTYGGAVSIHAGQAPREQEEENGFPGKREGLLPGRVDVLVASSVNPRYDSLLLERVSKKRIPVIAESIAIQNAETVVSLDNYQAGLDLGQWAGRYAQARWKGRAVLLDLTYHLANTQARSRGFIAGMRSVLPEAEILLSLNAQSRFDTAYQLTRDALSVHNQINIIFAINDTIAWGAIQACEDLEIDPENLVVLPFGLEGDTLKEAMIAGAYCKAGLAMFPEIVGPACVEAAISAHQRRPLPRQLLTPYRILTPDTLTRVYRKTDSGWELSWEALREEFSLPVDIDRPPSHPAGELPRRIGFVVPFRKHEWYQNLINSMQAYCERFKIEFEVVDAEQSLKDEVDLRRRQIAHLAAEQVQAGDVVLIDGGPIANYLAEALNEKRYITAITNALPVFDILRQTDGNTLILTGGAYRQSSRMLVGPTAEGALRELRADKLFLMVTGITFNFGLSHTNLSEVTMKQAMIRSAREVILLADHTFFGQESVVQVAPLSVVHKLITDDALPASTRLELSKLGIQIILASI